MMDTVLVWYVGNNSPHYDNRELFEAASKVHGMPGKLVK